MHVKERFKHHRYDTVRLADVLCESPDPFPATHDRIRIRRRVAPPGGRSEPRRSAIAADYLLPVVVDAIHGATVDTREYMPYLSRRAHPSPQLTTPINVGRPPTRVDSGPPLSP